MCSQNVLTWHLRMWFGGQGVLGVWEVLSNPNDSLILFCYAPKGFKDCI